MNQLTYVLQSQERQEFCQYFVNMFQWTDEYYGASEQACQDDFFDNFTELYKTEHRFRIVKLCHEL